MKYTWINKPSFKKMSFSHFWEYYKFHAIFGLFALILVVSLIYSIATNKSADLTIQIIGNPPVQEAVVEPLFQYELGEIVKDANNDNKAKIDVTVKNLDSFHLSETDDQSGAMKIIEWDNKPSDADYMLIEKITTDLTAGEPALYIIDGDIMQVYMTQGVFAELEEIEVSESTEAIVGESELDKGKTHIYGYSLKNNRLLKNFNIDTEKRYIGVRVLNSMQENNPEAQMNYQNAMNALMVILSFNE